MYLCVTAIELCPASSASTRTPMPLLASRVINVLRGLWLLAPFNPHAWNMLRNSWHMVFALKCPPFWLRNRGAVASVLRLQRWYSASAWASCLLTNNVRFWFCYAGCVYVLRGSVRLASIERLWVLVPYQPQISRWLRTNVKFDIADEQPEYCP